MKEKVGGTNYKNILDAVKEYKIDAKGVTKFAHLLAGYSKESKIYGNQSIEK